MVTAIGENEPYRNKLYPPPGQNQSTAEGGGLSKASIYWELFKLLWGNDYPKFVKYLQHGKAKEREVITDKIKYPLTTYVFFYSPSACNSHSIGWRRRPRRFGRT
jgi:hypothetical protein